MKTIEIPRIVLCHPNNYINRLGRYDLLGCILVTLGYDPPDKTRFPSDLKLEIPHFTRKVRRTVVDTPLTIALIDLDCSPQKEAVDKANILLKSIDMEIRIID